MLFSKIVQNSKNISINILISQKLSHFNVHFVVFNWRKYSIVRCLIDRYGGFDRQSSN